MSQPGGGGCFAGSPREGHRADDLRDMYGFPVKAEFGELYKRFAPIYEEEERERSERWAEFLGELQALLPSLPGEDEAALLRRLLTHLASSDSGSSPADTDAGIDAAAQKLHPAQATALLQRLSSLVQAGVPMAKRGTFWRLFLNVGTKRREGEYGRLSVEIDALEQIQGGGSSSAEFGCGPQLPGAAKIAAAAAASSLPGGSGSGGQHLFAQYNLVADASSSRGSPRKSSLMHVHTFSITRLEEDDNDEEEEEGRSSTCGSPLSTPLKASADAGEGTSPAAAAVRAAARAFTPLPPCGPAPASQAALDASMLTPASTLLTPVSSGSSRDSAVPSDCGSAPPNTAGQASTAERWRQQDYMAQIDKDLHRTFPGHPAMDAEGRATLRRILAAYARRNPTVGYCQGLNFLAATFLLFMAEEDAFWCLCALVEDVLGTGYFDERMVPVQVDVLVFGHLLQGRFPTLWGHLRKLDVEAASVTMHWFLCCFLNSLPPESTLRVWDQLFFEGSPVVLFRVALALLEIYEQALMFTHESSDAYMLLQVCAQMSFDASRLVDTAACGYAHLQPAGLAVLRQRYQAEVLENVRYTFPTEEEYELYLTSSGSQEEDSRGRPSFATTFRSASLALIEAEEAVLRAQRQRQGLGGDNGHFSPAGSSRGSGSRVGSPGADSGSSGGGSQASSPLVRVQHAVRGLTSRLMPSALPMLLPAGAMSGSGQEMPPLSTSGASQGIRRPARPVAAPRPAGAGGGQESAAVLRCISVGERSGSAAVGGSPATASAVTAGTGAALGRHAGASRLTPFLEVEALLMAAQQQQQGQEQHYGNSSLHAAGPWMLPFGQAGVAQSQPATPTARLLDQQQHLPRTHRRAQTAGHSGETLGHSRRRRRLTLDLLGLANMQADLQQPAVAAAFKIAANPSPQPGSARGGSSAPATAALGPAGMASSSFDQELLLPVRTLQFDEQDAGRNAVRQAVSAPPVVLLSLSSVPDTAANQSPAASLPAGLPILRRHTTDGATAAGEPSSPASLPQPGQQSRADVSGSAQPTPATAAGAVGGAAAAAGPSPERSPVRGQQRKSLLSTVGLLQEEVAVAESRRHEAEQEAAAAQQTAADLRQQLGKVEKMVAAKETLVAELSCRLQACGATFLELSGKIAARQLAVDAEAAAGDRRRRQVAAADALIRRLMDAVAQTAPQAVRSGGSSGGSSTSSGSVNVGSGASSGGAGSASRVVAPSPLSASSGSPQSSSGSVAPGRWGGP